MLPISGPKSSRRPTRDYSQPAGTRARAFWYPQRGVAVIADEELPERSEGWCTVRALCSAVSPGTERIVFTGQVPLALYDEMRCPYMGGEFTFPVKYGYSLVGEVVEGSPELLGRLGHVLHPHQDFAVVRCEDLFPLPPHVPAWRATLASNLETAVNAIWDSDLRIGDSALVIGFGVIGSLVARILSWMPGVRLEISDTQEAKLDLARRMGFRAQPADELRGGFDLVFHASGAPEGLQTAIDQVGFEGRVVELSWYGTQPVHLHLGETFHSQRKTILSSQVSTVSASRRPRWDMQRRKRLVFRLLEDPRWDAHLTRRIPFEKLPSLMEELTAAPSAALSVLVTYNGF